MGFGIGSSLERRKIKKITKLMEEGNVHDLLNHLSEHNPKIISETLKALGNIAHKGDIGRITVNNGVERIGVCLRNPDKYVRLYAVRTLCWIAVKGSPSEIVSGGVVPKLVNLLNDDEPDTIRYSLAIIGELVDSNQTSHVVNADGTGPIGSLVVNRDEATSQLAMRLLGKMGEQGYGSKILGSGAGRLLILAASLTGAKGRETAEKTLFSIAEYMGYSDINTFKEHISDAEYMAGRSGDFETMSTRSMDAYFSGGATGVNTIEDVIHHHDQGETGHTRQQNAVTAGIEDEEFVLDDIDVMIEDEFDLDLDIMDEAEQEFPFPLLMQRLRDVKKLADEGVLNANDYYHIKAKVIEDVALSVKLDCMNCYDVLEIEPSADAEEIKRAYRKLASQYHPDKVETLGPKLRRMAMEEMTKLNHAKQTLLDSEKRYAHDALIAGNWSY